MIQKSLNSSIARSFSAALALPSIPCPCENGSISPLASLAARALAALQDADRAGLRIHLRKLAVGLVGQESLPSLGAVRRQAQVAQGLFHRVVPDVELHDLARLVGGRYL